MTGTIEGKHLVSQNVRMGKTPKETKAPSRKEQRKPARMVRVRELLALAGDKLAERLAKDLTEIVNDALREKLEREGLWPPK